VKPGEPRKVVGLIGDPLRHSISPRFQQAGFDFLGLPVTYEAWETPPERVHEAVQRVRQPDCLGMNVTVPHKQTVMPLLDEVDARAARIGAINTVRNQDGRLTGYNTDAEGLVRALEEQGFILLGAKVAILGAGGVARAAAFAFAWAEVARLTILARRADQAWRLAQAVEPELSGRVHSAWLPDEGNDLRDCDLIVNCTSLGMLHSAGEGETPLPARAIGRDALVYDLVYNPPVTPLLAAAKEAGAKTLGGLPMLVYQGAAAFELWTGQKPPVGLMMARAEEALRPVG
jgi:shikimate dehydrogenase